MLKKVLLVFVLTIASTCLFSQETKVVKIKKNIHFDSINLKVKTVIFKSDELTKFYFKKDTIIDTLEHTYSIGKLLIIESAENKKLKFGMWHEYYPNGQLKSKGSFDIGAYFTCNFVGPKAKYYSFKSGYWKYYNMDGFINNEGTYDVKIHRNIYSSFKGDGVFVSKKSKDWIVVYE